MLKGASPPSPSLSPSSAQKTWDEDVDVFAENIANALHSSRYLTYPLVYLYSELSSSCPAVTPLVVTPLVFIGLPESLSS